MEKKQLFQYGAHAAAALKPDGMGRSGPLCRALKADLARIKEKELLLFRRTVRSQPAEWLLDNSWLARREGTEAAAAFRRAGRMRKADQTLWLMGLARAFVQSGEEIDGAGMAAFLAGTQSVFPFTEQELSLWICAIRLALVERVAALCPQIEAESAPEERREEEGKLSATLGALFSALKYLAAADLSDVLEEASLVESLLRQDPAGIYTKMDDDTRRRYRYQVCRLAKKHGISEAEGAGRVLSMAMEAEGEKRHVGYFLFRRPLGGPPDTHSSALYFTAFLAVTLAVTLFLGFTLRSGLVTLLLLLPISDIVKNCAD
ncbi:MAG: hypothetical protein GX585_02300, partial [Clostridiales bacterium]|nr:hypothetical protein [Clostridiales bacterium]